ncbi:hypothetical protein JCM11251_001953 [Rhodosporidiobolus azoricus]
MSAQFDAIIPKGSLLLVTGVNGLVGSHVANEALALGFRVRGVVRDAKKADGLKKTWDAKYPGQFEVAVVEDATKEGAFDEVVKGVSGFAHVSAIAGGFPSDLDLAIHDVKAITFRALEAAAKEPSVKRVVLTSSVVAARNDLREQDGFVGQDSWNDESVELAKEDGPMQPFHVYMASKAVGEKAAWEWVEQHKPSYEFYTVNPCFVVGKVLDASQSGSTSGWVRDLYHNKPSPFLTDVPALTWVGARDIALLHLGGLLLPTSTVAPQRLFGGAGSANANDFLALFRRLNPSEEYPKDFEGKTEVKGTLDTEGSLAVLKAFGREGWTGFEEAVKELVAAN